MEKAVNTVVVASIPRCGSTMLARAIAGMRPGSTWPKGRTFVNGVHKTHRLPHEVPTADRYVFVFGDPHAAVRSTIANRFDAHHAANCGCSKPLAEVDLLARDDFGYERIWDAWAGPQADRRVLMIRYPTFWRHLEVIEAFVGRPVLLPAMRERSSESDHGGPIDTYDRLAGKMDQIGDCCILEPAGRPTETT